MAAALGSTTSKPANPAQKAPCLVKPLPAEVLKHLQRTLVKGETLEKWRPCSPLALHWTHRIEIAQHLRMEASIYRKAYKVTIFKVIPVAILRVFHPKTTGDLVSQSVFDFSTLESDSAEFAEGFAIAISDYLDFVDKYNHLSWLVTLANESVLQDPVQPKVVGAKAPPHKIKLFTPQGAVPGSDDYKRYQEMLPLYKAMGGYLY